MSTEKPPRFCKVCEDKGAQMFFGAQCCGSCKIFFRRNHQLNLKEHHCVFDGECDITVNSRGACRYCRLKKCFSVGLQKEMIRCSHSHQNNSNKKNKKINSNIKNDSSICLIPTINLLNNDKSLLTSEQWSLLSNILNNYVEYSSISTINKTLSLQMNYPSKIRLKIAKVDFSYITSLPYINVAPFAQKLIQLKSLSKNDQSILIKRNTETVGNMNAIYVFRQTDVYNNPYFYNESILTYGNRIIKRSIEIIDQSDINGLLFQLILPIIFFSTSTQVLDPNLIQDKNSDNESNNENNFSNSIEIYQIQNIYIELLFKYMLYQFDFQQTIKRFTSLIKTCLDLISLVVRCQDLQKYDQMLDTIVKDTQQILILDQQNII